MVSDGSGGAIIAWGDYRGDDRDVYAQRINASGVPQWTPNGEIVSAASGSQHEPKLLSDGSGGAIISWADERNTCSNPLLPLCRNCDIYAQRVNASGVPQWAFGRTGRLRRH